MIDIIIPAYNSQEYIENAICSIIMQSIKDKIKLYIVDDCSQDNYDEIVTRYSDIIRIKLLRLDKNSGPGVARQVGLDNSNSKYIMFMDADDILSSCYSVENLYNYIEDNNSNVVSSYFLEEANDVVYEHYDNSIWLHGKMYRRKFLDDNNIRFNDTRANEDTGFNKLILLLSNFDYINEYTYIWKCNKNSITRSTDYNFYGLEGFVYNIAWAIEEGIKRKVNPDNIAKLVYENILEMYYRYVFYKDRKDKDLILKWTYPLKKYIKYISTLDDEVKKCILKDEINKAMQDIGADGIANNNLGLDEFIKLLKA